MRTFILLLTVLLFTTANVYSKTTIECKDIKKNSPKYFICKTKAAGSTIKDKLSKKVKSEKKSDKKSFIKRFGEAKSLSDLTK
ncbi:MAG TPA: hypothetical protein QF874_03130 [Pelagibacteraceae bacterium]|jgi:hypothetical protein|nr:hypothetical protein [Pelagibacteraceae bacterium]